MWCFIQGFYSIHNSFEQTVLLDPGYAIVCVCTRQRPSKSHKVTSVARFSVQSLHTITQVPYSLLAFLHARPHVELSSAAL